MPLKSRNNDELLMSELEFCQVSLLSNDEVSREDLRERRDESGLEKRKGALNSIKRSLLYLGGSIALMVDVYVFLLIAYFTTYVLLYSAVYICPEMHTFIDHLKFFFSGCFSGFALLFLWVGSARYKFGCGVKSISEEKRKSQNFQSFSSQLHFQSFVNKKALNVVFNAKSLL